MNYKVLPITLLLFLCLPAGAAKKQYGSVIVDKVIRVYDGDTFFADIQSLSSIAGENIGIRVSGIDTPEIKGSKCKKEKELAIEAKQAVVNLLGSASIIRLDEIQRGKYFRIVATVMIDGQNLSEILIRRGLAVAYDGGTKTKDWCDE